MDLITLVVTLIVIVALLWAINTYATMGPAEEDQKRKTILNVVVVIAVLLGVFSLFTMSLALAIGAFFLLLIASVNVNTGPVGALPLGLAFWVLSTLWGKF